MFIEYWGGESLAPRKQRRQEIPTLDEAIALDVNAANH